MKKKQLFVAFLMAISFLFINPITSHADSSVKSGDCTIYYTRTRIQARVDDQSINECHFDCKINSIEVTNKSGETRIIDESDIRYCGANANIDGEHNSVESVSVPVDTKRHTIADVLNLESGEYISNVDVSVVKEDCTFSSSRTNCSQKRCIYCHKSYTVDAEHDYEWVVDKKPTCEHVGTKHEQCKVCGERRNEGTEIEALGHDWQEATVTQNRGIKTPATYKSNAVYYKKCSRCGTRDENEFNEVSGTKRTCLHEMYPDRASFYYTWNSKLGCSECRICGDLRDGVVASNIVKAEPKMTSMIGENGGTLVSAGISDLANKKAKSELGNNKSTGTDNGNGLDGAITKLEPETQKQTNDSNADSLVIKPNEVISQAENDADNPFIPVWGIIVLVILVLAAGGLAFWEFFFRDYLKEQKKKEDKTEQY